MKHFRSFLIAMIITGLISCITFSCGSEKAAMERRNLMIPKKSELPRNSRYKEVEKRKTNKIKTNKSKNKKLF